MLKFWRFLRKQQPEVDLTMQCIRSAVPDVRGIRLIGQTIFSDSAFDDVNKLVDAHDIPAIALLNSADVMMDILQVYLVEDGAGRYELMVLIDPFEPYDNPYIVARSGDVTVHQDTLPDREQ
jgi:hypothetical protein